MKEAKKIWFDAVPSLLFVALIWGIYGIGEWMDLRLFQYGLYPRRWEGLIGIFTSPFIHGSVEHVFNNSVPLLVLGFYLFHLYPKLAWKVIIFSVIFEGVWTWISARDSYHIGASGVVYAFFGFLSLSGLLRKNYRLTGLSLLVVFLYGSMVWGVLPIKDGVSFESHLWGLVAGFSLAVYYRKVGEQPRKYTWDIVGQEAYVDEAEAKFGKYYWDPVKREQWLKEQEALELERQNQERSLVPPKVVYFFRRSKKDESQS